MQSRTDAEARINLSANPADGTPGTGVHGQPSSFYGQANPRIGLNKSTITALRTGGIADSQTQIAAFANEAIVHVIRSGQARKPSLADLIALEAALGHRLEELNILLLAILQNVVDLAGLAEKDSLLGVFDAELGQRPGSSEARPPAEGTTFGEEG